MVDQGGSAMGQVLGSHGGTMPPPLGITEVVHATSIKANTSREGDLA